jgi:hypothetical protein
MSQGYYYDFLSRKTDMRRKKIPAVAGDFRKKRYTILANGCRAFGKDVEAASRPKPEMAALMPVTT